VGVFGEAGDYVTVATAVRVELEVGCGCGEQFPRDLYLQMASGRYDECAVLEIPTSIDEWRSEHRTARKRADRAERRGYRFRRISRERRVDEIHRINVSAPVRQGRPMSDGYTVRPAFSPLPEYPCPRHAVRTYGVETVAGELVAYLYLYRAGQLALVSQILGHASHLEDEIMYLLVQGVLTAEAAIDPDGVLVYNRFDSGSEGLRFFKQRLGFRPERVEWAP
jgi:hypothetical protein